MIYADRTFKVINDEFSIMEKYFICIHGLFETLHLEQPKNPISKIQIITRNNDTKNSSKVILDSHKRKLHAHTIIGGTCRGEKMKFSFLGWELVGMGIEPEADIYVYVEVYYWET